MHLQAQLALLNTERDALVEERTMLAGQLPAGPGGKLAIYRQQDTKKEALALSERKLEDLVARNNAVEVSACSIRVVIRRTCLRSDSNRAHADATRLWVLSRSPGWRSASWPRSSRSSCCRSGRPALRSPRRTPRPSPVSRLPRLMSHVHREPALPTSFRANPTPPPPNAEIRAVLQAPRSTKPCTISAGPSSTSYASCSCEGGCG